MKTRTFSLIATLGAWALHPAGAETALTVYNQGFALVRQDVPLDLRQGVNEVRFTEITAHAETASVVLRDPAGKRALQILEQDYRADPVSQELLLAELGDHREDEHLPEDRCPDHGIPPATEA